MPTRFIPGWLLLLTLGSATPTAAQVVAMLNEVAVGGSFEEISAGSAQIVGNGRFVAFTGYQSTGPYGLWLKDLTTPRGVIQRFDFPPDDTWTISPDARYVAFVSDKEDVVPGKANLCWHPSGRSGRALEPCFDLYVRDLTTGAVARIHGPEQREISADVGSRLQFSPDGRWIVYQRSLADLPTAQPIQVLLHDREQGTTTLVSGSLFAHSPSVSKDAMRVTFVAVLEPGTPSANLAVMAYDRTTGFTERVDVDESSLLRGSSAVQDPRISADGRYVAFQGWCVPCPQFAQSTVYLRDLMWKRTWRPIRGLGGVEPDGGAELRGLSENGRFVLFDSASKNLVENDQGLGDVFVLDRFTNQTVRVSQGLNGAQPNGVSFAPDMDAATGRIVFRSQADSLAPFPVSLGLYVYLASLDLDNDRLHDSWERFFGISPLLTDPAFDEDGDGLSNLQEFERQTHPRGRYGLSIQVPPEGTGWGIKLHNLGARTATVVVRVVDAAGNSAAQALQLPPLSLTPVRLADIPDRPTTPFTLQLESDEPVFGLSRDWRP